MPDKFGGNVAGVPVGAPTDDPFTDEYYPSGDYGSGFVRRSLPSERFLDELIYPCVQGREDGYIGKDPVEIERQIKFRRRHLSITEGNVTGEFPGPPDRARRSY